MRTKLVKWLEIVFRSLPARSLPSQVLVPLSCVCAHFSGLSGAGTYPGHQISLDRPLGEIAELYSHSCNPVTFWVNFNENRTVKVGRQKILLVTENPSYDSL